MNEVQTVLITARALIDTPEKWTKGTYARDAEGLSCSVDAEACSFCAMGAMYTAAPLYRAAPKRHTSYCGALGTLTKECPYSMCVVDYNDDPDTEHKDIMALFDRAIEASKDE